MAASRNFLNPNWTVRSPRATFCGNLSAPLIHSLKIHFYSQDVFPRVPPFLADVKETDFFRFLKIALSEVHMPQGLN